MTILSLQSLEPRARAASAYVDSCTSSFFTCCKGSAN